VKEQLNNFISEIKQYDSLAIIGLSKNVGKTTSMNEILKLYNFENVSLTSIGYDGEDSDLIFKTHKPSILIKKGMLLANAKRCVLDSEIRFEILETTSFNTPLGEIVIVKALDDGLVKLAGPSHNAQLKKVVELLHEFGGGQVIVDGALNRKSFANPSVCQATLLCTGMTIGKSYDEVAIKTKYTLDLLQIKQVDNDIDLLKSIENPVTLINKDLSLDVIDVKTSIASENIIASALNKENKYLYINGVLTDNIAQAIIRNRNRLDDFTIVVDNGTNVFVKERTLSQLDIAKIKLRVIDPINVKAIAINPCDLRQCYDSEILLNKIEETTGMFAYDFVEGGK